MRVELFSYALKPIVIAIVAQAVWNLGSSALKNNVLRATAVLVAAAFYAGVNQIILLFGAGFGLSLVFYLKSKKEERETAAFVVIILISSLLIGSALALSAFTPETLAYAPSSIFWYFLKIGSAIYGSGYVLLAFLRTDLVAHYHWLTQSQLIDAIAAGQITPGPVFTTATFIGYVVGGAEAATLATVGIFLPAFVLVAATASLVHKMRASKLASAFLDAVNAAALALMTVVLLQLARAAIFDIPTAAISMISTILLLRFKLNPIWLMLAGLALGALNLLRA
jgi:chromate transporter